jgi:glycosyltransferase involved in cell wall biosynthesis
LTPRRLTILIPVFDEWGAASPLLGALDTALAQTDWQVSVLLADDGSNIDMPSDLLTAPMSSIERIDVLRLRRNLGHQRAIAIGLAYLESRNEHDAVVVMDGDGEDSPADVPRLLARFDQLEGRSIVFAARAKRTERVPFRFAYQCYRVLHRALTGISVRVGNFSVLPAEAVSRLVVVSDLWSHYAASVFKVRIPHDLLPLAREQRLSGTSRMNTTALVAHGLSAIAVFGERVGVRGMVFAGAMLLLTACAMAAVVLIRFVMEWTIPGWFTLVSGLLLVLAVQLLTSVTVFSFVVLASRDSMSFLPCRDYVHFVRDIVCIWEATPRQPASAAEGAA